MLWRKQVIGVLFAVIALATSASSAEAGFINSGFETGDFTGWTVFTTTSGEIAPYGVESFDTAGTGASLAATFNVGITSDPYGTGTNYQGGGVLQSLTLTAGSYTVSADIAAALGNTGGSNGSGGRFELLIDNVVYDTVEIGSISSSSVIRDQLQTTQTLSSGTHEFRFRITRDWYGGSPDFTPHQYIDNITLTDASLVAAPAPPGIVLLASGAASVFGLRLIRRRKTPVAA